MAETLGDEKVYDVNLKVCNHELLTGVVSVNNGTFRFTPNNQDLSAAIELAVESILEKGVDSEPISVLV
jgi:hypothetical protein